MPFFFGKKEVNKPVRGTGRAGRWELHDLAEHDEMCPGQLTNVGKMYFEDDNNDARKRRQYQAWSLKRCPLKGVCEKKTRKQSKIYLANGRNLSWFWAECSTCGGLKDSAHKIHPLKLHLQQCFDAGAEWEEI